MYIYYCVNQKSLNYQVKYLSLLFFRFHHTSVYVACIFGLIRADPAARYFALMNTFVHSVMYSYYALKVCNVYIKY